MKIIAVMSPKGGIGKTTTSDSIAYMLGEEQGKRVLKRACRVQPYFIGTGGREESFL